MNRISQTGTVLIVGLVMLLVFMLMVTGAFVLSSVNLKAVGNMQSRTEAVAAANAAIELVIQSPFTESPAAEPLNIDINNDGLIDYEVVVEKPECIRFVEVPVAEEGRESGVRSGIVTPSQWNTLWNISASVSDSASGAMVKVRSGVWVLISQSRKDAGCSSKNPGEI